MFSNRLNVLKFTKLHIIILHLYILMECLNYFSSYGFLKVDYHLSFARCQFNLCIEQRLMNHKVYYNFAVYHKVTSSDPEIDIEMSIKILKRISLNYFYRGYVELR